MAVAATAAAAAVAAAAVAAAAAARLLMQRRWVVQWPWAPSLRMRGSVSPIAVEFCTRQYAELLQLASLCGFLGDPDPKAGHYKAAKAIYETDQEQEAKHLAELEERLKRYEGLAWKAVIGRGEAIERQAGLDVVSRASIGGTSILTLVVYQNEFEKQMIFVKAIFTF